MGNHTVGHLCRHFCHERADRGQINARCAIIFARRCKHGCHQVVLVKLAIEIQFFSGFPTGPDSAHGQDKIAHASGGLRPGHTKPAGDMRLDLRTQADREATPGVLVQIPGQVGHRHWITSKGDTDGGSKGNGLAVLCCQHKREKRVRVYLCGKSSIIATLLQRGYRQWCHVQIGT